MQVSTIILAAGQSNRMGKQKFALKLPDGRNFIEAIIENYLSISVFEIVIVTNSSNWAAIEKIADTYSGICKTTLNPAKKSKKLQSVSYGCQALTKSNPVFIHPIDSPFVGAETLRLMYENLTTSDYVFPEYENKGGHPVLVSPAITESLKNEASTNFTLRDYLNNFEGRKVIVKDRNVLNNINTPNDFRRFLSDTI